MLCTGTHIGVRLFRSLGPKKRQPQTLLLCAPRHHLRITYTGAATLVPVYTGIPVPDTRHTDILVGTQE